MKLLDLTLPTAEENLACDEALLDGCEVGGGEDLLRFWEPRGYFVVLGYANNVATEVDVAACAADGVPILRRCSGGGTVLQGPGCLNYSLILRIAEGRALQTISGANRFIMQRHRDAFVPLLGEAVAVRGHTDLALSGRKFSGNSQRRRRHCLLFHGTFLLELDLARVERYLRMPSRQPAYRRDQAHSEFLTNLGIPRDRVKALVRDAWGATDPATTVPFAAISALVREKYSTPAWNFRR
jgi:lipoate-protein ligase A